MQQSSRKLNSAENWINEKKIELALRNWFRYFVVDFTHVLSKLRDGHVEILKNLHHYFVPIVIGMSTASGQIHLWTINWVFLFRVVHERPKAEYG